MEWNVKSQIRASFDLTKIHHFMIFKSQLSLRNVKSNLLNNFFTYSSKWTSSMKFSHENLETRDHFSGLNYCLWQVLICGCKKITRFFVSSWESDVVQLNSCDHFFILWKKWDGKKPVLDCRAWISQRQVRLPLQTDSGRRRRRGRRSRASYYTRISHFKREKNTIKRLFCRPYKSAIQVSCFANSQAVLFFNKTHTSAVKNFFVCLLSIKRGFIF